MNFPFQKIFFHMGKNIFLSSKIAILSSHNDDFPR